MEGSRYHSIAMKRTTKQLHIVLNGPAYVAELLAAASDTGQWVDAVCARGHGPARRVFTNNLI